MCLTRWWCYIIRTQPVSSASPVCPDLLSRVQSLVLSSTSSSSPAEDLRRRVQSLTLSSFTPSSSTLQPAHFLSLVQCSAASSPFFSLVHSPPPLLSLAPRILIEDIWTVSGTELKFEVKDNQSQILSMLQYIVSADKGNFVSASSAMLLFKVFILSVTTGTVQISFTIIPALPNRWKWGHPAPSSSLSIVHDRVWAWPSQRRWRRLRYLSSVLSMLAPACPQSSPLHHPLTSSSWST